MILVNTIVMAFETQYATWPLRTVEMLSEYGIQLGYDLGRA